MLERILKNNLSEQLKLTKKSILLLGPRQTGKSTLIKELFPDLTINLARETTYREHLVDPQLIERQVAALPRHSYSKVFIDEIQRLPSILNTIQAIIDDNKHISFLLTGSSARKLKRGAANLLPGRIFQHKLFPLLYWEIKEQFDLEKILQVGTLPEVYLETYGPDLLKDYIDIYLREEIIAEAILRKYVSYSIFLELAAKFSGQEINYAKLASDSEIPKESIRRYIEILDDTLLIQRLPGFTATVGSRKAVQREKIIFFDLGVRNGILGIHQNKFTTENYGFLFEQWCILQIIYYSAYFNKGWKIYYYRDDLHHEVDVIVDNNQCLIALEIKWGRSYKKDWQDNLKIFAKQVTKKVKKIIIYRGETIQKDDDILVVPLVVFMDNIEDYLH